MKWFSRFLNVHKVGTSLLYDSDSFYPTFLEDLSKCESELNIESPFITAARMETLYPIFQKLLDLRVRIHIVTRDPVEHEDE